MLNVERLAERMVHGVEKVVAGGEPFLELSVAQRCAHGATGQAFFATRHWKRNAHRAAVRPYIREL